MHKACLLSELASGDARRLDTAPPIDVFHTQAGGIFAIDDTCTHQDASSADGYVEDCWAEWTPSRVQVKPFAPEP